MKHLVWIMHKNNNSGFINYPIFIKTYNNCCQRHRRYLDKSSKIVSIGFHWSHKLQHCSMYIIFI